MRNFVSREAEAKAKESQPRGRGIESLPALLLDEMKAKKRKGNK